MASSNKTGLGRAKKRSQQVLTMAIEVLEKQQEFISLRKLYSNVYDKWNDSEKQVSWTRKELSSLLSSHIRQPLEGFHTLEKSRKVNKYGVREIHYRVEE
jgi:hypothetical protein|tara:strand:+ start:63 stop:362 length:300 start_codon:yes stop_codon:yes gene_type:complete